MSDTGETVRNYYRRQGVTFERNRILTQIELLICFEFKDGRQCKHQVCRSLDILKGHIDSVSLFESAANSVPGKDASEV